jgi:predicted MPP superfamily phosphohydrolase
MPVGRVEEIVAATNALKPDLVLLLGDYPSGSVEGAAGRDRAAAAAQGLLVLPPVVVAEHRVDAERYMPVGRVEEIVAATNALKPDLVLLLGDYPSGSAITGMPAASRARRAATGPRRRRRASSSSHQSWLPSRSSRPPTR